MPTSLQNPILRGFFPDPTVCRVGADFYLACSTFEFFPGVPLFHSRDLANWRPIGHALTRPSQLPLAGCGPSRGIFAPTLRHHAGTFYLITTNVGQGGNFLVTATDPAGPWSEPVWIDESWFDPSLLFDTDGKVYYTRRGGHSVIVQAEIDVATGKLLTPLREIATGFVSPDCEGPHLYHIGDWYYLLLAEGGSRTGHMVTISRARSPWGPFSACPRNPILSNRHLTNNPVRSTGHGELFDAPDGSWWMAFLGTRHEDYETFGLLGRESHLAPVTWDADGWPVVNSGRPADLAPVSLPWPAAPFEPTSDNWIFSRQPETLANPGWVHLRARDGITHPPGAPLRLESTEATLDDCASPAFLGRRVPSLHTTCSARIESLGGGECGLTFYLDHRHHLDLVVVGPVVGRTLEVRLRLGDGTALLACLMVPPGAVTLTLSLNNLAAAATAELSDGQSIRLGAWDVRYLAPEVAGAWTGLIAAAFAQRNATADLHRFSLGHTS